MPPRGKRRGLVRREHGSSGYEGSSMRKNPLHRLREDLYSAIRVHQGSEATLPEIVSAIGDGVGSNHVLEIQDILASGSAYNLDEFFPNEVWNAIRSYRKK